MPAWTCRRLLCAAALMQPPPPLPPSAASRVLRTYTWQDRNFLTTWVSGQCHGGSGRLPSGCCLKCGAGREQGPLLLAALQRCHRHTVCRPTLASRLPPTGLPATCCILQVPVERLHVHIRKLVMAGHKVRRAAGPPGCPSLAAACSYACGVSLLLCCSLSCTRQHACRLTRFVHDWMRSWQPAPPAALHPQVGVVRQVETAAIKKAGDNKSGPFERRMTALHTRATLEVGWCCSGLLSWAGLRRAGLGCAGWYPGQCTCGWRCTKLCWTGRPPDEIHHCRALPSL